MEKFKVVKGDYNSAVNEIDLKDAKWSYIFGFLSTDGHLQELPRDRGKLTIELKYADKDILEKIKHIITCKSFFN